jgi:hypothetical protein
MLESASASDYRERRHNEGPAGVSIAWAVQAGLEEFECGMAHSVDVLLGKTIDINWTTLGLHRSLYTRESNEHAAGLPLASAEDESVRAMKEVQNLWLGLTAAHIVVVAELRGGELEMVPFYEPQSISDVPDEPYYPFATT